MSTVIANMYRKPIAATWAVSATVPTGPETSPGSTPLVNQPPIVWKVTVNTRTMYLPVSANELKNGTL